MLKRTYGRASVTPSVLSVCLLVGCLLLSVSAAAPAHAQVAVETLQPAVGLELAEGTGFVVAGVGLDSQPESPISFDVPKMSLVRQVILYWEGRGDPDDTIDVDGRVVQGELVGESALDAPGALSSVFRADITDLGLVSPGNNVVRISEVDFGFISDGAGLFVIYDNQMAVTAIALRDGSDFADGLFEGASQTMEKQVFEFAASDEEQTARLALFIANGNRSRPDDVEITIGEELTIFSNEARRRDGDQWDTIEYALTIPPGVTTVAVQPFSRDGERAQPRPDSIVWAVGAFAIDAPQCEAEISGIVWDDADRDGVRADTDAPLGVGVVVVLRDAEDTVIDTRPTNGKGRYAFSSLCPGTYSVEIDESTLPAGVVRSPCEVGSPDRDSNCQPATVVLADFDSADGTIDFGYNTPCSASVGNFVWQDLNRDGIQDAGEPGIQGVSLTLRDANGSSAAMAVTGASGDYSLGPACAGTYTVELDAATLPPGLAASPVDQGDNDGFDSDASPVTVTFEEDDSQDVTVDFGFNSPCAGTIGDFVWQDLNRDGIQDSGEPGIQGVVLTLGDGEGSELAMTTTAGDGSYEFAGLCAGTYSLAFDSATLPAEFIASATNQGGNEAFDSNPSPATVVLAGDESADPTIDFGFNSPCTGTIGDRVWQDVDRDGIQDAGEPGIQGVELTLKDVDGNIAAMATTDGGGAYEFSGLCLGTYTIELEPTTLPKGFIATPTDRGDDDTNDSDPLPATVTLETDESVDPTNDFGFNSPCRSIVGDFVWQDLNRDGTQDAGEPGIAGVELTLKTSDGDLIERATTDGAGAYRFVGLCAGDYIVEVDPNTVPPELVATPTDAAEGNDALDSDPTPAPVSVSSDREENLTLDFGYNSPCTGTIGDFVWRDIDRDGIQDAGEPGIEGVDLTLKNSLAEIVFMATTDANGAYSFTGLCAGEYIVEIDPNTLPENFVATPTDQGENDAFDSDPSPVSVTLGDDTSENPTIDFGFNSPCIGGIGDFVWQDLNRDGVQNEGEPGIQGVKLNIKNALGEIVGQATTDGTGTYAFGGLCLGEYTVEVDPGSLPPDFIPTSQDGGSGENPLDSNRSPAEVLLETDETVNNDIDFGYNSPCTGAIGDRVWQDLDRDGIQDEGEPGIQGVELALRDPKGTIVELATTEASGAYSFSGLCAGDYTVEIDPGTVPPDFLASPSDQGNDEATDSNDSPASVTLTDDTETRTDIDFGFNSPCTATIGDFVWEDLNRDGVQDFGEPGIAGVVIIAKDSLGQKVCMTTTDTDGRYEFAGLCAGEYFVEVDPTTLPEDVVPSPCNAEPVQTPSEGSGFSPSEESDNNCSPAQVFLDDDETQNPTVDFGFNVPCSGVVSGLVWHDLDANGIRGPGENGIGGLTVRLETLSREVLGIQMVGDDGRYSFGGLCAGTYVVKFDAATIPEGFEPTLTERGKDDTVDSDPTCTVARLAADTDVDGDTDFGFLTACPPLCRVMIRFNFFSVPPKVYDEFYANMFFLGMSSTEILNSTARLSNFDPRDLPESVSSPDGSVVLSKFSYANARLTFTMTYEPPEGREFGDNFWFSSALDNDCDIAVAPFLRRCEFVKGALFPSIFLPGTFEVWSATNECEAP